MENKVKEIVCEVFKIEDNNYSSEMMLSEMPEYDSLNIMKLMMDVEQKFEISIEPEDLVVENFHSPTTIMGMLGKYLSTQ